MDIISPTKWKDYELIDSGHFEKLERFGKYIIARPEPQAVWDAHLSEKEWQSMAHASFIKAKGRNVGDSGERGEWKLKPGVPEQWCIHYPCGSTNLTFRLGFTAFKHIGIFPEQAANWDWLYDTVNNMETEVPRFLNLFAYTGGASLAARAAGADVTHVDSVKQVISWSRENMEKTGLSGIRWVVEDAMKFVRREVRRGNTYHGIILDPPAYGRGPEGEKWVLEEEICELLHLCKQLLKEKELSLIINLYSMGFSTLIAENLFTECIGKYSFQSGEFFMSDRFGMKLPLGLFLRSYYKSI